MARMLTWLKSGLANENPKNLGVVGDTSIVISLPILYVNILNDYRERNSFQKQCISEVSYGIWKSVVNLKIKR